MKFTIVFTTLLCISTSWAKKVEDLKDKREAPVGYGAPSSHSYQSPASYSQGDASAISVGAGYSIGGQAKPTYSFGGQGSSGALQIPSEGLSPNGHATIKLAPITLQPGQFSGADFSQIMNQITQNLNAGGLSLQPSNAVAEFHQGGESVQGLSQGQEYAFPQFSYGMPKYELPQQLSNAPSYSPSAKGLNSYTSTGPVLFSPNDQQTAAPAAPTLTYGAANSGHSLGDAGAYSFGNAGHSLGGSAPSFGGSALTFGGSGYSLGGSGHNLGNSGQSVGSSGNTLGGSGHSLGSSGYTLGGSGHSLGGAGLSQGGSSHSLGSSGLSLGNSGHSLGGSFNGLNLGVAGHSLGGSYKQLSGGYAAPSKNLFRPSTFLGASIQNESGFGTSSLSGSQATPSFSGFRGTTHGGLSSASFGSQQNGFGNGFKFSAPVYQSAKPEGLDGASSLSSHYSSPPGTTYGTPSSSYSANSAYAASSNRPSYASPKYRASPSTFTQSSTAYRAPAASQSSLSSYSSAPKYSFAGSSSPYEAADAHGSASETVYNTIKYSEELKPRAN